MPDPKFKISFDVEIHEESLFETNHFEELKQIVEESFSNYDIDLTNLEIEEIKNV